MGEIDIGWIPDDMSDDDERVPEFTSASTQGRDEPGEEDNRPRAASSEPMILSYSYESSLQSHAANEPMSQSDEEVRPQPPGTSSGSVVESGKNKGRGTITRGTRSRYRSYSGASFSFCSGHGRNDGHRGRGTPFRGNFQGDIQPGQQQIRGSRPRGRSEGPRGRGEGSRGRGDYTRGRGMIPISMGRGRGIIPQLGVINSTADDRIAAIMNNFSQLYLSNPVPRPDGNDQN